MKNFRKSSAAFTLVEMLVVIAIISLVALAMSRAVRGARRQANAAKCQANMKNLHTAVMGYLADNDKYPLASSYETVERWYDNSGTKSERFFEERGWVSWLPSSGSRRDGDGKTVWQRQPDKSHAKDFEYFGNHDDRTVESIREGVLFKYAGKDLATYRCPEHTKTTEGEAVSLAYAMNSWFGCHSRPISVSWHDLRRTPAALSKLNSSRMALFIELNEGGKDSSTSRKGQDPNQTGDDDTEQLSSRVFADDCVWEWDVDGFVETGLPCHRKARDNYTHVVFVDGHVASVSEDPDVYKQDVNPESDANSLEDIFVLLGKGEY